MKKLWNFVLIMWRPVLIGAVCLSLLAVLLGFKLSTLTPGLSTVEIESYAASQSLTAIYDEPVNAPYKLLVYGVTSIADTSFALRLVSALIGAAAVILFFIVSRKLLNQYAAYASTFLFATSGIFLHSARLGTPNIMLLSLLALATAGYILRFSRNSTLAWIFCVILAGISLYVPGLVIFILAGIIWQFKNLKRSFEQLKPWVIAVCAVLLILLIAPIILSIIREPGIIRQFVGLPSDLPNIITILKVIAYVPLSIFGLTPINPVYSLGRQPILSAVASVFFLFGLYRIMRHPSLDRRILLLSVFVLGSIWIGFTGSHQNTMLLAPFIYLAIGKGLQHITSEWHRVFPRNPLARATIVTALIIAIGFSANFQLNRYFIAWAHSPDTEAVFQEKL